MCNGKGKVVGKYWGIKILIAHIILIISLLVIPLPALCQEDIRHPICQTLIIRERLARRQIPTSQQTISPEIKPKAIMPPRIGFIEGIDAFTLRTERYRILWGEEYDRTDLRWRDSDGNSIPDYVDRIALYAEDVWQKVVIEFSFLAPENTEQYYLDIFIANTGIIDPEGEWELVIPPDYYGYATYYTNGTPYFVLRDDLDNGILKVVIAHEFFHTVQFRYKSLDEASSLTEYWWYEASAVWMEDALYDEVNDYLYFLPGWFRNANLSLLAYGYDYFNREYGSVVWAMFLTEHFHTAEDPDGSEVIKEIWEGFSTDTLLNSMQSFFTQQAVQRDIQSIEAAFQLFMIANLNPKEFYAEGELFPEPYISKIVELSPYHETRRTSAPQYLGYNYLKIDLSNVNNDEMIAVQFDGYDLEMVNGVRWGVAVAEVDLAGSFTYRYITLEECNSGWIFLENPGRLKEVYLLVGIIAERGQSSYYFNEVPYIFSINTNIQPAYQRVSSISREDLRLCACTISLKPGWNLISIPYGPRATAIEEVLGEIMDKSFFAWSWDATEGKWRVFSSIIDTESIISALDYSVAALTEIKEGRSFWINLLDDEVNLTIELNIADILLEPPLTLSSSPITLTQGWDMVGFSISEPRAIDDIFGGTSAALISIWSWDTEEGVWRAYSPHASIEEINEFYGAFIKPLTAIQPGIGYWINLSTPIELSLD